MFLARSHAYLAGRMNEACSGAASGGQFRTSSEQRHCRAVACSASQNVLRRVLRALRGHAFGRIMEWHD